MKSKTHLPGKDLPLEETIEKATSLLRAMDLQTEAVSWLNPAPNCWSVHIESITCPQLFSNGKGSSRLASLASGLGEFFERLSTNFFFADYFLDESEGKGPRPFLFYPDEMWFPEHRNHSIPHHNHQGIELLDQKLRSFYDPEGELSFADLCDNNSNPSDRGICALPFRSLVGGRTTYFPVSLLNNLYVSNGMAAGNSAAESCSQALSEIIERYVKNMVIGQGISLPDVPERVLRNYPKLCAIIDTLAGQGLSVRVKDGSLGGEFPVISVLLTDFASGGAFAAFGANCRFETAVERTLTELLQGRSLDRLRDFQPPSHDLGRVADPYNLESHFIDSDGLLAWRMFKEKPDFRFSPWDFAGNTDQEFDRLQRLIGGKGFSIYQAEYNHCGMYSCRFLIPGMSEIYPVEDLVWNNKGTGARLRPHLLHLPDMATDELDELFVLLDTLDLSDQLLISHVIGIVFDESSAWASLRIGELKALMLLAMGRKEEAMQWCNWCLELGALPAARKRLYRLLQALIGFYLAGEEAAGYARSLHQFYSREEIEQAELVLNGKSRFPGLHFARSWQEISFEQRNLLKVHERLNSLKAAY